MIDEILAMLIEIPLTRTFRIAVGSATHIRTVIIGIRSGDTRGFGEAPASVRLAGESVGGVIDSLSLIKDRLFEASSRGEIYEILHRIHGGPATKAGIEASLWDLTSKLSGLSPSELRNTSLSVETDMTVSLDEPEREAEEAKRFVEEGFNALKVKLDGNEEKNIERLKRIREVAPDAEIRVDFNTALKNSRAYKHMRELERFDVELFEQPVKNIASLLPNKLDTPLFADESASNVELAMELIDRGIDGIVIKLAKHGLEGARFLIEYARRRGSMTLIGCTSETGIGASFLTALAASGATYADIDSDIHLAYRIDERTLPEGGIRRVPEKYFVGIEKPSDISREYIINIRRWSR